MRNAYCRNCNMARKLKKKKMRNTDFRFRIWQENRKTWERKWKAHFRTWNMARNTEKRGK